MIDPEILEPCSRALYNDIALRLPLWLDLGANVATLDDALDQGTLVDDITAELTDFEKSKVIEFWKRKQFFGIRFPAPVPSNPPLYLKTIAAEEEIEVWFGNCQHQFYVTHCFGPAPASKELDVVEEYIAKIVMEELIAIQGRRGKVGFFCHQDPMGKVAREEETHEVVVMAGELQLLRLWRNPPAR